MSTDKKAATGADLHRWLARHHFTYATGAVALGVGRSTLGDYLKHRDKPLPPVVALAAAAVDAGLPPLAHVPEEGKTSE